MYKGFLKLGSKTMEKQARAFSSIKDLKLLTDTVKEYYDKLETYPAVADPEYGFLKEEMPKMFSNKPRSSAELLNDYMDKCIPNATHWQSPYYFSFFPANSLPSTVLGEMAMTALNEGTNLKPDITEKRNAELETKVMGWVADLLNLPDCYSPKNGAHAIMYNTAGDSFLNVALAAKNKKQMEMAPESIIDRQVGYMSTVSNLAVERSIKFSNLHLHHIRCSEPSDKVDEYPLTAEQIEKEFQADIEKGLVPTYFITTIGSTNSLSIENVREIAKACEKYGVWLHVDSAQLGVYASIPEYRFVLNDIEYADSFTTNGHKSLGCGMGTNFTWVKHKDFPKWLTYNSDPSEDGEDYSIKDRSSYFISPPCSNRALRTMIHLLSLGKKQIVENFKYHFTLADYFRELMQKDDRFEILQTKNNFPLVMFRLKGLDNAKNSEYLQLIMKSRKIFMVSSEVHGVMFLRMSIGTYTQEEKHIKDAFDHIQQCAEEYLATN